MRTTKPRQIDIVCYYCGGSNIEEDGKGHGGWWRYKCSCFNVFYGKLHYGVACISPHATGREEHYIKAPTLEQRDNYTRFRHGIRWAPEKIPEEEAIKQWRRLIDD